MNILFLNVALLVCAFVTAVAAFFGATRDKQKRGLKSVTKVGWISIVFFFLTLGFGTWKEILTNQEEESRKRENAEQSGRIEAQLDQIKDLKADLEKANTTVGDTRTKLIEGQTASRQTTDAIQAHAYNRLSSDTVKYILILGNMIGEASDGWLPSSRQEFFSRKSAVLICWNLNSDGEAPVLPKRAWHRWFQEETINYEQALDRVFSGYNAHLPPSLIQSMSRVLTSFLLWYPKNLATLRQVDSQHNLRRAPLICPGLEKLVEESFWNLSRLVDEIAKGEVIYRLSSRMNDKTLLRGMKQVTLGANRFGPKELREWDAKHHSSDKK